MTTAAGMPADRVKPAHRFEQGVIRAVAATIGNLPLDVSSGLAAALGRPIGMLALRRRGERNLAFALPKLSRAERTAILRDVIDNFTRTGLEYVHLRRLASEAGRIETEGLEHLEAARIAGQGAVLVTGHFGNWEVIRLAAARMGWPPALIYRAFNNPLFDAYSRQLMSVTDAPIFHKGRRGSLGLLRHVRKGGAALILTDQRFTKAPHLPFFGHPARTALAAAEIAGNYGAALIPVRGERLGRNSRFKVIVEPPIDPSGRSAEDVMTEVNARIEGWVRAQPGQYFWMHNRWGKAVDAASGG